MKMELILSPEVLKFLIDKGYDPTFGARPLKRTVQKHVQDPIALKLLTGEIKEKDRVKADTGKNAPKGFWV